MLISDSLMKNLDPAALDCLAALADDGSFERAAQRLSITQSAVSQRLRALEAQVGPPLVVRSRPLRLTEPGKVLLRFARQLQAMRADVARELGETVLTQTQRLPIAVNADSLATWVLPALDALVQPGAGRLRPRADRRRPGLHPRLAAPGPGAGLRQDGGRGAARLPHHAAGRDALCGGGEPAASSSCQGGCRRGLVHAATLPQLPFLVFNRKDDMQAQWVTQAFGVTAPRLSERFVPSSEAYARAATMGWGIGVLPELQVRDAIARSELIVLYPQVSIEVALYWHQWKLGDEFAAGAPRAARLDEVGAALVAGAAAALDQRPAAAATQRRAATRLAGSQRATRPRSAAA